MNDVIQELGEDPQRGAITTFTGVVRSSSVDSRKKCIALEIEVWEEKGDEVMTEICQRIGTKHQLLGLRIVHIRGYLELGDPIVYIVISSAHRKEAFVALEDAIQAYKQESPVWKKEIYEDNSSQWITTAK